MPHSSSQLKFCDFEYQGGAMRCKAYLVEAYCGLEWLLQGVRDPHCSWVCSVHVLTERCSKLPAACVWEGLPAYMPGGYWCVVLGMDVVTDGCKRCLGPPLMPQNGRSNMGYTGTARNCLFY